MNDKNKIRKDNFDSKEEVYYGVGGFFIEIIKMLLLAVVIVMPMKVFLFQPFFVQGDSMKPNFENGQYLIVNEIGYKITDLKFFTVKSFREIKRGDVVIFRYPKNPKQFFIKRVIGLPGERIKVNKGKVFIYNSENTEGMQLDEVYLPEGLNTAGNTDYQIGDSEYFVMGDNRSHSSDSRTWGPVGERDIIGKVPRRSPPR